MEEMEIGFHCGGSYRMHEDEKRGFCSVAPVASCVAMLRPTVTSLSFNVSVCMRG